MNAGGRGRRQDSPRAEFFRRFTQLFEAAGNPTLRRLAAAAEARMRAARGGAGGGVAMQRISDWKAGRNLPARFDSFRPVLLTLIDEAHKSNEPVAPVLLDVREWARLWNASTSATPEAPSSTCPYRGLTAYRRDDAELFFGRARPTRELADLVRRTAAGTGGIVMVVGASGAGKSSLLAAGLAPELADDPEEWTVAALTPGAHPARALAAATDGADWPSDRRRLLIVDQLEELFTHCHDEQARDEFLAALHHFAVRGEHEPAAVAVAIRADFYARCLDHPVLEDALKHRSYLLGPMRLDELAEAMTGPAELAGYRLESGLEDLVITELCGMGGRGDRHGYDPGALPLLSHVMAAAWERRDGAKLTIDGYRDAGGVHGSVAATAEQAWRGLTEEQQGAAKQLLLELVTVGQDSKDTRRRVPRADLVRAAGGSAAALEALTGARLVTLDADSAYLTHEIVLDAWPRLRGWIDEDRAGSLERQRVHNDAADWVAAGRDSSRLYRGGRLETAHRHAAAGVLTGDAAEFLAASHAAHRRGRRRASTTRAALAMLGVGVLLLAGIAFVLRSHESSQRDDAVLAAVLDEADRLATVDPSLSAQFDLVADRLRPNYPDALSRLLFTQNLPLSTRVADLPGAVYQLAYQPGGAVLAVGDDDNDDTIQLWNVADPRRPTRLGAPLPAEPATDTAAAFSGDGTLLASSGAGLVRLWDVRDPANAVPLPPLPNAAGPMAFNPVGRTLAVATDDNHLALWNFANQSAPTEVGPAFGPITGRTNGLAFNRFGTLLAVSDGDGVELWNVSDPAAPQYLDRVTEGVIGRVNAVAISPDGAMLAAGSADGRVSLWNIAAPAAPYSLITPLTAGDSAVLSVGFSPDSRILVEGSSDKSAQLWSLADPARPHRLGAPLADGNQSVQAALFSPDGRWVATGGDGGSVREWSLPATAIVGPTDYTNPPGFSADGSRMVGVANGTVAIWDTAALPQVPAPVTWVLPPDFNGAWALSPDGTRLAAGLLHAGTRVYDIANPAAPAPLRDLPTPSDRFNAFSSDSRLLATGNSDNSVQVWDLSGPSDGPPARPVLALDATASEVTFSPHGRLLATAGPDSGIVLSDLTDPARARTFRPIGGNGKQLNAVAFSPDQRTLASVGQDRMLRAWDIGDLAHPRPLGSPLTAGTSLAYSVSFSPDGHTVATGSEDGAVRLWDFTDRDKPKPWGVSIALSNAITWNVVFDPKPDSGYLAGAHFGNVIQLWDLDPRRARRRICTLASSSLTPAAWRAYLPSIAYQPPCR